MMTENKTMKIRTEYNTTTYKEINARLLKNAINIIAFGCIMLALCVIAMIVSYVRRSKIDVLYIAFIFIPIFFVWIGVMNINAYFKATRKPLHQKIDEYEFFDGGIAEREIIDGKVIGAKYYYNNEVCKTIESKHYLFIYINAYFALVIDKSTLYPAELDTIKSIYFKQRGEHVLELAPFNPGVPTFVRQPEQNETNNE